jgi:hypothetical protein
MVNDAETVCCDRVTQAHPNRKYKRNEQKIAIICSILTFTVNTFFGASNRVNAKYGRSSRLNGH